MTSIDQGRGAVSPVTGVRGLAPLAALAVAACCTVLPILAHPHLPLTDLPNHIARHAIQAEPGGPLSQFYTVTSKLVPNSAVDLLWRFTGFPGTPERFSQIVLAAYALALIAATMLLSRTVQGRWTAWPAASGLLVFNAPFFWGFENYVVSIPFAIAALAIYLGTEGRPTVQRCALLVPLALALYTMHFFGFAALAIAALGREVQRLLGAGADWKRQLGRGLPLAVPFLVPIGWMLSDILTSPPAPSGSVTQFGGLSSRFELLTASFEAPGRLGGLWLNLLGLAGLVTILGCLFSLRRRCGARLVMAPALIGPAVALAAATLAAPLWLNGVALVHIRLPFVLLTVLLAGTAWTGLTARQARALALWIVLLLVARGVAFERFAADHSAEVQDLVQVLDSLPAGSRLLPLRAAGMERDRRLWHVQAYAVSLRGAFVPTLFQGVHDLQLKKGFETSAHPALFSIDERRLLPGSAERAQTDIPFLEGWQDKFTHALLLDAVPTTLDSHANLTRVDGKGRFTLYRISGSP
ncbi:hypothetical protein GVY41_12935 [Frigidibacter albus]|uniref:Glycosyltransferase RgtA/B/C/D-like domain-containing protein n=1 Tax=Frigidibacter albus TaxID=1465486 RepID=A0A6L8VK74_9RHOB|nr:hypothetical protein [Frigidibacter albus]MZQ89992.1 hypothetical protein [Frigidibacter albus]NBE31900.1 hypothetical protein [Frigidibacter albus]GGH57943.1 hypothetical protein GCM10011341_27850 [Frigidibacter albus]